MITIDVAAGTGRPGSQLVHIDPDLNLGKQYGYHLPGRVVPAIPPRRARSAPPPRRLTDQERHEIVRLYLCGATMAQVAQRTGRGHGTVHLTLVNASVPRRTRGGHRARTNPALFFNYVPPSARPSGEVRAAAAAAGPASPLAYPGPGQYPVAGGDATYRLPDVDLSPADGRLDGAYSMRVGAPAPRRPDGGDR